MGSPDSRWLGPVLESLSGGTILRTTSLGQGALVIVETLLQKQSFVLKLLLLKLCLFEFRT
jgi:hypothetical protein